MGTEKGMLFLKMMKPLIRRIVAIVRRYAKCGDNIGWESINKLVEAAESVSGMPHPYRPNETMKGADELVAATNFAKVLMNNDPSWREIMFMFFTNLKTNGFYELLEKERERPQLKKKELSILFPPHGEFVENKLDYEGLCVEFVGDRVIATVPIMVDISVRPYCVMPNATSVIMERVDYDGVAKELRKEFRKRIK